ncbi:MAG: hypothetical protein WD016_11055 [Balneolaceae bacterium]
MSIQKLKIQRTISILITVMGISLLIFMITVEDEPGAIPLAMIVIGSVWYFITKSKIRSEHT